MKWHDQRRKSPDILVHSTSAGGKLVYLLHYPLQIAAVYRRIAIANRVDPQDAIMFCQQCHYMLFTERITVPIVGETDNVFTLYHLFVPTPLCTYSAAKLFIDLLSAISFGIFSH